MKLTTQFIVLGVLLLIGGVFALAYPFATSVAITQLVGALFAVGGAFQLWAAIAGTSLGPRFSTGLAGVLALAVGFFLLLNPLEGVVSLTLLVGILFLITGIVRLVVAWGLRDTPLFWLLLLSGAVSTLLGILVIGDLGGAATALLGVMLAIELIADGSSLIALGVMGRNLWK